MNRTRTSSSFLLNPASALLSGAALLAGLAAWSNEVAAREPIGSAARSSRSAQLVAAADDQSGLRDLPARTPVALSRADTLSFGYVQSIGGALYAVPGETWTFDHAAGGPEGWYAVDVSNTAHTPARRITAATWAGHDNGVPAPIVSGEASAWFGTFEDEADALCWISGLGYGNNACQRWVSPALDYAGTGDVSIAFDYFNDTEDGFDYTRVRIELADGTRVPLNGDGFTSVIGNPASMSFAHGAFTAFESSFEASSTYRLVFELTSDGGWSDEDSSYPTSYGPFGMDNLSIAGSGSPSPLMFDYESGAQGWTSSVCAPRGSYFGIAPLSDYTILDPCGCGLSGNVLELHDAVGAAGSHPVGQHEMVFSPLADKSGLSGCSTILAEWDQYSIQPQANGVFTRPGWNYYPYVCPVSGVTGWSGRIGQDWFTSFENGPTCFHTRNVATDNGVPSEAALVGFVWEIYSSCDAFAIPSTVCTNITNFTPLIDNLTIRVTQVPCAPVVKLESGGQFQDGFGQLTSLSTTNTGNADCTWDLHRDSSAPARLGDSLFVRGPVPSSSSRWESRLWWRVRREGPGQAMIPGYSTWKTAVSDGLSIVGPAGQFTFGRMDSVQWINVPLRDRSISEFREDDDDFAGEGTDQNEMIWDGVLAAGSQVQYFITSNYTCTPVDCFYLPDTTGGNLLEFEILPSWRIVGDTNKFPCILTLDLNTGEQPYVERALNVVLNGAAFDAPVPNPTRWDRYDYNDASSNWNAPFARPVGGNNGINFVQMLGYRQVVLYTGNAQSGSMEFEDFHLMGDWLSAVTCGANNSWNRQGWIGSGENLSQILVAANPAFSVNYAGAIALCDDYNASGCGPSGPADESYCVRVEASSGAPFPPIVSYDVYGNWCPEKIGFDVLHAVGGGIGNRVYQDYDRVPPANTNYAQVVRSVTASNSDNYRSVLSGYSWGRLSTRDAQEECVGDEAHTVNAIAEDLRASLRWIFGGDGEVPSYCTNPCACCADVGDDPNAAPSGVTMLYANRPNPFSPRTSIRFALGVAGQAELSIYDVRGRRVRTLVSASLSAGEHSVVWDGTDDQGHAVGAGVFWSQLRAGGYESQRKMVVLK